MSNSHPVTGWPVSTTNAITNNNNSTASVYMSSKNVNNSINRMINLYVLKFFFNN